MTDSPDYRKYLEKCFEVEEEKARLRQTGINAQFRDVNHILNDINEHLKRQNGSIAKLQLESDKRKVAVEDFRKLEKGIGSLKKKWFWIFLGAVIFVIIFASLGEVIGLKKVFELWLNKM